MSQPPAQGEAVGSCDVGTLNKLKDEHKDGFFLIVSQKGCGDCTEMKDVLNEVVKDAKPVIDADIIEDESCFTLAEQLKVGTTPTVFYYLGGEEKARIEPGNGLTWDSVRQKVRELMVAPVPVTPSTPMS